MQYIYLKYGMSWLSEPDCFHLFHLSSYSKGSASCSNSSEIIWVRTILMQTSTEAIWNPAEDQ